MRVVVQRVSRARVLVEGEEIACIGDGFLLLVGIGAGDAEREINWMADKVGGLRIFRDDEGKMNRGLDETGGEILAVSQFTLYGDCRKGRRPSFVGAAPPEKGALLFETFVESLRGKGIPVKTGRFQTTMQVELVNDGPVTLIIDRESSERGSVT